MKILVAGIGRLGGQAVHVLSATGHQITAVDASQDALNRLDSDAFRKVRGDACELDVLEKAGAYNSDLMIAATGDDEDNLVISLLAKRHFAIPRVLARVNDPDNTWLFDLRWGVDVALPAEGPLVALIDEATGATDTIGLLRLAAAGVTLVESRIRTESAVAGHTVADIALPHGTVVAAIIRNGQPTVPGPTHRIDPGDTLLLVTSNATEHDIETALR
ncbi:TrkA family potassium uptake protein [Actinoplanes sp. KI2]|uniref:potassium channel family protein n=1 Tax=Actinoplanes sp. KI2 TaxID=2983315 RepID=UPI0021D5FD74|nr:TrkA family potassium uptake protein [Actinoplanes sp. KI2]MCU7729456.1 TrkA family potassium uptake protein [Actinoplanes sp. KI2]